jgi:hypothetical protein
MKVAIMQPYLFPYIGYFQLIQAADKFLLLDDVAYIKKGWINRNRILVNGRDQFFVIPLEAASQNKAINSLSLVGDEKWKNNLEATISMAYRNTIGFNEFFPVIREILRFKSNDLSRFLANSIRQVCDFLDIKTPIVDSTAVFNNVQLKGADRIIDLCKKEHADAYLNAEGGKLLYDKQAFRREGISLHFLKASLNTYPQAGSAGFVPGLSIIDMLMNNQRKFVMEQLSQFSLE